MSIFRTDPLRLVLLLLLLFGSCTIASDASEPVNRGWVPGRVIEVPVDYALLDSFRGEKRKRLLQYLACNAIWRVTGDQYEREISNQNRTDKWQQDFVASLRLTPPFFEGAIDRYYQTAVSEFGRGNISLTICSAQSSVTNAQTREQYAFAQTHPDAPAVFGIPRNWNMQIRLVVKGEQDPVDQTALSRRGSTAKIQMSSWAGVAPTLSKSTLEVRGPEVSILIFESSEAPESKDPFLTMKALSFVQDELKRASAAIDKSADFDAGLFATGSVKNASADSFEYGYKILTGYANPGKPGILTLHCGAAGPLSFLPILTGGSDEKVVCGWSTDSNKRFYFAIPYYFNSGDGPGTGYEQKDFNYDLRFSPLDGSGEHVLWKMDGAQVGSAEKSKKDKEKEIESLIDSAKQLQRLGRLDDAESKLKTAVQKADEIERLTAFEQGSPLPQRAVNSGPHYQMSWKTLDRLASFYTGSLMFDRARPIVLRLQALEEKAKSNPNLIYNSYMGWLHELGRWRELVDIDLGLSNFKNALSDNQKLNDATKNLSNQFPPLKNDADRNGDPIRKAKEISQKLSVMVSSRNQKKAIAGQVKQSDLVSLLNSSQAVVLCRIDGWSIGNGYWCGIGGKRVFQPGSTDVYVTTLRAFTGGCPADLSRISLNPDRWEDPQSAANTIMKLQSIHQNALIFFKRRPYLTSAGNYSSRSASCPLYFDPVAVLPASDANIRMLEQLTRQSASSVPRG